jgi:Tfp pilus assembly protein PilZ
MVERRAIGPVRGHRNARARVVRYRTVSAFLADYDQNLSRGAVFVNSRQPLAAGAHVRLTISLGRTSVRNIEGQVTRSAAFGNEANEVPGMHVAIRDGSRLLKAAAEMRADQAVSATMV